MFINHSDGRKFHVSFRSHFVENSVGKHVRETTCKMAIIDDVKIGRDRYNTLAHGTVRQNSRDRDSRPEGRKKAFGEALKYFSKMERVLMWHQYDPFMKLDSKCYHIAAEELIV